MQLYVLYVFLYNERVREPSILLGILLEIYVSTFSIPEPTDQRVRKGRRRDRWWRSPIPLSEIFTRNTTEH